MEKLTRFYMTVFSTDWTKYIYDINGTRYTKTVSTFTNEVEWTRECERTGKDCKVDKYLQSAIDVIIAELFDTPEYYQSELCIVEAGSNYMGVEVPFDLYYTKDSHFSQKHCKKISDGVYEFVVYKRDIRVFIPTGQFADEKTVSYFENSYPLLLKAKSLQKAI